MKIVQILEQKTSVILDPILRNESEFSLSREPDEDKAFAASCGRTRRGIVHSGPGHRLDLHEVRLRAGRREHTGGQTCMECDMVPMHNVTQWNVV